MQRTDSATSLTAKCDLSDVLGYLKYCRAVIDFSNCCLWCILVNSTAYRYLTSVKIRKVIARFMTFNVRAPSQNEWQKRNIDSIYVKTEIILAFIQR